jgi:nucleoside-diphosphate-sugar epimerase
LVNADYAVTIIVYCTTRPNNGFIVTSRSYTMTSTVLILGAAGRIGQALGKEFADAGWNVLAQARKPLPSALAGRAKVAAVRCDVTDVAALISQASNAAVVVNALNPPYTEWDRLALPLADAAQKVALATGALLMLPGNVYNFGREIPPLLTLATAERGDTPKARIRIELEARLAAAAQQGLNSVVIRAGDFFGGAGTGNWFDMALASKLAKGDFIYPGNPEIAHAWAYLPDLAKTFVRVAERRDQLHGHHRLHFAGHTSTGSAIKAELESLLSRKLQTKNMPWGIMKVASPFMSMWRELLAMRYLWDRPHALDGSALRNLIGEVPHASLREALRGALAEVRPIASTSAPAPIRA